MAKRKSISKIISKQLEQQDYTEFFDIQELEELSKLYDKVFK